MGSGIGDEDCPKNPNFKSRVAKYRQIVSDDPTGLAGWENCWEKGVTPWDLGQPTPVFVRLLQKGMLPKGRVLIPGCGSGYDVVAIAGPERYVVGVDFSYSAIKKAKELSSSSPNTKYFTFLEADFFSFHPSELFDLIIDYTFFCAIEPSLRSPWAKKMRNILKPDGELITLMYPISGWEGGPPYCVSLPEYEKVLNPIGFEVLSVVDNELAIERRNVLLSARYLSYFGFQELL